MSPEPQGGLSYRVQQLERTIHDQNLKLDDQAKQLARLEPLPSEVKALRGAAYKVGGMIVAASITFAVSVLTVFS